MRKAAESSFCAAVVASIACGGSRQLSQLPQLSGGSSPKWRSRIARRQPAVSTKAASAFSRSRSPARRLFLDLGLDPPPGAGEILGAPEQPGLGRLAVAAGAAGFLIISLDRFGDAGMGDEAHVGLVDAHAEGDRRDHHHLLGRDERGLVAGAHRRLEPGMIRQDGPAGRAELLGELLGLVAARRIDDARPRLLGEQRLELARDAVARADMVADIGPVEAGDDQAVLGNAELDEDVRAGAPSAVAVSASRGTSGKASSSGRSSR